jgi:hypothetical protein
MIPDWRVYALGSALFAALILWARNEWQRPDALFSKGVLF